MTRVLSLVSYHILPAKVGGQKGIALFNKYFSRHVQLICVATRKNQPDAAEGYEVLNVLSDSRLRYINLFYFFTLKKKIRQRNITHLLLEQPYYGWLAVLLKWVTGIKLIVHSHNMEGLRWKTLGKHWWKLLWYYEKWVHRQANYNFFIQEEDRAYAIQHFGLLPEHCTLVTYGIELSSPPSAEEKKAARAYLLQQHAIPSNHHILLFNGAFNYLPNINGLKRLLQDINPALNRQKDFLYTLIICGRDIPAEITRQQYPHVIFAGFVDDITVYFKGATVFLNPITEGGGIKTKLVEALGYDLNAVSTKNGAIGIDLALCNGKLRITDDALTGFTDEIIAVAGNRAAIPPSYFEHFYWEHITQKAASFIERG